MSLTLFTNQLHFAEGPRWHDGSLWCADMHGQRVLRFDHMGVATKIIDVPQHPSGLGWLPDGRMLVVSMDDQRMRLARRLKDICTRLSNPIMLLIAP